MELPFYLMSQERPGISWDGVISLEGEDLHFELRDTEAQATSAFDIPLRAVRGAAFQRGLVSRKLSLLVRDGELRNHFPAGVVNGEEVQLMVARDDAAFGPGEGREAEFERLAGTIARRAAAREQSPGLVS